jgi:hypothetical protein
MNDALADLRGNIGTEYQTALAGRSARPTGVLRNELERSITNPQLALSAEQRSALRGRYEANIFDPVQNVNGQNIRNWDLPTLWKHQSTLRQDGQRIMRSPTSSAQDRDYAHAMIGMADDVTAFIQRRFPATGQRLQDLARPNAQLSTLRLAAGREKTMGDYTPQQLAGAAEKQGPGAHEYQVEAALMGPLLERPKNPWTSLRGLRSIAGAGAALTTFPTTTATIGGLLATRQGQRFLTGQANSQQRLADLLEDPDFAARLQQYLTTVGSQAGRETKEQR